MHTHAGARTSACLRAVRPLRGPPVARASPMTDLARNLVATKFRYDPVDTGQPSLPTCPWLSRIFDGLPLQVGRCVGTTAFQRHDVIDHSARSAVRISGHPLWSRTPCAVRRAPMLGVLLTLVHAAGRDRTRPLRARRGAKGYRGAEAWTGCPDEACGSAFPGEDRRGRTGTSASAARAGVTEGSCRDCRDRVAGATRSIQRLPDGAAAPPVDGDLAGRGASRVPPVGAIRSTVDRHGRTSQTLAEIIDAELGQR